MDRLTLEERSLLMSRIRGRDTKPEILVRHWLYNHGFRYRIAYKRIPGHPDVALPKYKAAIFVQGCFWHFHEGCSKARLPKTRVEFWQSKLLRNRTRDEETRNRLKELGWRVLWVWECSLVTKEKRESTLERIRTWILGFESEDEIPPRQ